VFRAFRRADRPTVAIAMGEAGLPTRVLALREEHCFLTYAMLGAASATAPGQITARQMREAYGVDRLRPTTRAYGLLGPHLELDRVAEYNTWFRQANVDGAVVPFVAHTAAADLVSAFRELPVSGWHVHGAEMQATVVQALDDLAPSAARQNKANGIVRQATGALIGHWVESPRKQFEVWLNG
jgi:Type I 3-dehydroquinase